MNTPTFWGVVCALAILAAALHAGAPVEAAQPAPAADFNCEVVARGNGIDIMYCEPDVGPDLFMNGYGFMLEVN